MKPLFILFLSICIWIPLSAAGNPVQQVPIEQNEICPKKIGLVAPTDQIAQRGCCSWHKGVCGCGDDGRVRCCDGTVSPSCACLKEDKDNGVIN